MTDLICDQVYGVMEGETVIASVDFYNLLSEGKTLTGTPTVVELDADGADAVAGDLTISNIQINSAEIVVLGRTVAVGEAVIFQATGFLIANEPYFLRVGCDMTDGQHRSVWVKLEVPSKPTK